MRNATRARRLVASQKMAVLSTNSRRFSGFPFGSVIGHVLDSESRPLLLISRLAVHYRNLDADPRASLTIMDDDAFGDPVNAERVTLMGKVARVPETEVAASRAAYLARHPEAERWADFGDFEFFRMDLKDLYYIGGFGSMGWIMPEDFRAAED